jgi:hypothetical protein
MGFRLTPQLVELEMQRRMVSAQVLANALRPLPLINSRVRGLQLYYGENSWSAELLGSGGGGGGGTGGSDPNNSSAPSSFAQQLSVGGDYKMTGVVAAATAAARAHVGRFSPKQAGAGGPPSVSGMSRHFFPDDAPLDTEAGTFSSQSGREHSSTMQARAAAARLQAGGLKTPQRHASRWQKIRSKSHRAFSSSSPSKYFSGGEGGLPTEWTDFSVALDSSFRESKWFYASLGLLAEICKDRNTYAQRLVAAILPVECLLSVLEVCYQHGFICA